MTLATLRIASTSGGVSLTSITLSWRLYWDSGTHYACVFPTPDSAMASSSEAAIWILGLSNSQQRLQE